MQKDVVVLLVTYLFFLFILAVDVYLFGREYYPCRSRERQVARNGGIDVFLGMGVEYSRRGLQRPSAVVVSGIEADDVLNVHKYFRTAHTRCLDIVRIAKGIQFDVQCRG